MRLPARVLEALTTDIAGRMGWPAGGASGLRTWLDLPDPQRPPAPYDLASVEADLPAQKTTRSFVIATDYRTGSTLLAEALTGAGGYGVPLEYLQRGAMERRFARFTEPSPSAFLTRVMRARTSASGVFGIKLFWPESPALRDLPRPVVIHLRREDVLAQAVSTWTALNTHEWRATSESRTTSESTGEVPYDRARLMALTAMHAHHDACWVALLRAMPSLDVIPMTYEQLAANPLATITDLVVHLTNRGMPPAGEVPTPRLARQSNAGSMRLASRLEGDLRAAYPG